MATGIQLRTFLAAHTGVTAATIDRYQANLAGARLVRRSTPGVAIELTSVEIVFVLLALAAPHPAGAADAARALGNLSPDPPREGDATLLTTLAGTIEQMAARHSGMGDPGWELALCLAPLQATMIWPASGPEARRRYLPYAPADEPPPLARREFVITQPLLIALAKLYAGAEESDADRPPRQPAPPQSQPSPHDARDAESAESPTSSDATLRARVLATTGSTPPPWTPMMPTIPA